MPEEPFVPGLDPELREWILMQRELKEARLKALARAQLNVPSFIKYNYHNYWKKQLEKQLLLGDGRSSDENCQESDGDDPNRDQNMPLGGRALSVQSFVRILEDPGSSPASILRIAIERRHAKFLDMALEAGIHVDEVLDNHGRTALHLTVLDADTDKVECLLKHGAHINAKDELGNTPLILSIKQAVLEALMFHRGVTDMLIWYGADLNATDKHGYTALHRACVVGDLGAVEQLLKAGARVYVLDTEGKLAVERAGKLIHHVKGLYQANVKYAGAEDHRRVWAHLMSRQFVSSIFRVVEPSCHVCKRKTRDCKNLKVQNYRYWLLAHGRLASEL